MVQPMPEPWGTCFFQGSGHPRIDGNNAPLSNNQTANVLSPVFCLRCRLPPLAGLKFFFTDKKQLAQNKESIGLAGGKVVLLDERQATAPNSDWMRGGTVIISPPKTPKLPKLPLPWLPDLRARLTAAKMRFCPMYEITKAILYQQIKHYCNPSNLESQQSVGANDSLSQSQNCMAETQNASQSTVGSTQAPSQSLQSLRSHGDSMVASEASQGTSQQSQQQELPAKARVKAPAAKTAKREKKDNQASLDVSVGGEIQIDGQISPDGGSQKRARTAGPEHVPSAANAASAVGSGTPSTKRRKLPGSLLKKPESTPETPAATAAGRDSRRKGRAATTAVTAKDGSAVTMRDPPLVPDSPMAAASPRGKPKPAPRERASVPRHRPTPVLSFRLNLSSPCWMVCPG